MIDSAQPRLCLHAEKTFVPWVCCSGGGHGTWSSDFSICCGLTNCCPEHKAGGQQHAKIRLLISSVTLLSAHALLGFWTNSPGIWGGPCVFSHLPEVFLPSHKCHPKSLDSGISTFHTHSNLLHDFLIERMLIWTVARGSTCFY